VGHGRRRRAPDHVVRDRLPVTGQLRIVQMNETAPERPWPPLACTVTLNDPALLGAPVIRPLALIWSPGRRPVAEKDSVCPGTGSARAICTSTAVPMVPNWWPGSRSDIRAGLSWSRSVFPGAWIPLTVPLLVYCQKAQLAQQGGRVGLEPEL
jgi:hypothetical protein